MVHAVEQELKVDCKKRRLNVEIDEYLYGQIRRYCVSQDLSISDLTRKMWASYLQQALGGNKY